MRFRSHLTYLSDGIQFRKFGHGVCNAQKLGFCIQLNIREEYLSLSKCSWFYKGDHQRWSFATVSSEFSRSQTRKHTMEVHIETKISMTGACYPESGITRVRSSPRPFCVCRIRRQRGMIRFGCSRVCVFSREIIPLSARCQLLILEFPQLRSSLTTTQCRRELHDRCLFRQVL